MEKQDLSSRSRTSRSAAQGNDSWRRAGDYQVSGQLIARARRRAFWEGRIGAGDQLVHRFRALVSERGPDECWIWNGKKASDGSGRFYVSDLGADLAAHRLAYRLHFGSIGEGMLVVRSCAERACCNPAHLVEKSPRVLYEDGVRSGRMKPFASRPRETTQADIEFQIALVLESFRERTSLPALCRREGVSRGALRGWRREFVAAGRKGLADAQSGNSR